MGSIQAADDFQLAPGADTITGIQWWGVYGYFNTVTEPDNFTIRFYADDGGRPGVDPLYEYTVGAVGRQDTGLDLGGIDIYAYSAALPALTLLAGTTYWLSIVNGPAAGPDDLWFWSLRTDVGNGYFRYSDGEVWVPSPDLPQMGFVLTGDITSLPEPASIALLGMGLTGLAALGRKRRKP